MKSINIKSKIILIIKFNLKIEKKIVMTHF